MSLHKTHICVDKSLVKIAAVSWHSLRRFIKPAPGDVSGRTPPRHTGRVQAVAETTCAPRYLFALFTSMILREGRQAIITFIDYTAAFNSESHLYLNEALAEAGVSGKVRRVVRALFAAATGAVRVRQADGSVDTNATFNIARGVLQGDIFSPIAFVACLDRVFRLHDVPNSGVVVGEGEYATLMIKFADADDAALVDKDAETATARQTAITAGSLRDAAMTISVRKIKAMHIHEATRVSSTKEHDVEALRLKHKCEACGRTFPTQRGMKMHVARWCDGGLTQRCRRGSLADKAVKSAKKRAAEALRRYVSVGQEELENVYSFAYLRARLQCEGADEADVLHRLAIAQTTFSSLTNIWSDHRLSRTPKLHTYGLAVC